jgi:alpha-acetolactate decarboxylase
MRPPGCRRAGVPAGDILMRTRLVAISFCAALMPAAAQSSLPYAIETFGAFRKVILEGDFSPKVSLGAVMSKSPTVGIGAMADARGEITIHEGKLIVSYGKPGSHPAAESEAAALLATAKVEGWLAVKIEQDVAPADIDSFIARMAAAHGIRQEGPFPFQIRGTLASYVMHVNAEPTNGPHGMGQPIAITMEIKGDAIAGNVAGIYASPDLVGIVSHGGTRTHGHWVSSDGKSTAHLDSWGLKAGAEVLLPKQ